MTLCTRRLTSCDGPKLGRGCCTKLFGRPQSPHLGALPSACFQVVAGCCSHSQICNVRSRLFAGCWPPPSDLVVGVAGGQSPVGSLVMTLTCALKIRAKGRSTFLASRRTTQLPGRQAKRRKLDIQLRRSLRASSQREAEASEYRPRPV